MRLLPSLIAALATLLPAAARAEWVQVTSPNFVLYTDTGAEAARRYAEELELFDAVLKDRHGLPLAKPARRKLPIYLLRRDADLKRISPGISSNIAGFYTSELEDTYAVATQARRDNSTLLHEYVHHFMLDHFPYNYPGWLIEGYAEYFMTFKSDAANFEMGNVNKNRAEWLSYGTWLPYEIILKTRPSELRSGEKIAMYYAQSWALTHYMMSDADRRKQLDAYVRAVGGGGDPVKAMTEATGLTIPALGRAVRTYLTRGFPYNRFSRGAASQAAITIEPLPPGAGELLMMSLRVKGDNGEDAPEDKTDGPVLLAAARKAAAPYPGDRLASLVQARVEIKLGDLAVAERLTADLIAKNPNDVEALLVASMHRLRAAQDADADKAKALRSEARGFAGRAYKLDPNNYQTLIAYAQGREQLPGYPTDNDLAVLRDALELAPQVDSLRLQTAMVLASRDETEEAIRLLRPLALDPHGGEIVEAALALLGELGDAGGEPAS